MGDFRPQIDQLKSNYTKPELIDALADRLGERTTSVNPLTEAMFAELRPERKPREYARRSDNYSGEMSRVATNATALKLLLHEQVGRPLYEPVERLTKQDFAECIAAVDAYNDGLESGMGVHTPTALPLDVDAFIEAPPDRSSTPESPFESILDLQPDDDNQDIGTFDEFADSPSYVYVFDCTPPVDDEPWKSWDRRRAVQTKIEAGRSPTEFTPKDRAAHALNQGGRIYYVGSTGDIVSRIQEHLSGADKSAVSFTNTFPPQMLVKIEGLGSRSEAEQIEGTVASELSSSSDHYAYSDEK